MLDLYTWLSSQDWGGMVSNSKNKRISGFWFSFRLQLRKSLEIGSHSAESKSDLTGSEVLPFVIAGKAIVVIASVTAVVQPDQLTLLEVIKRICIKKTETKKQLK